MRSGIGFSSAAALVIANMIGAGVFTTSGFALQDLGRREFVLWAWVVGGVLALLGALSYAALARRLPQSGGEYHYLAHTVHPLAGFLAGWVSLLAGFTAPIAVAALTLQEYLAPTLGIAFPKEWLGTAAIAVAFLMHGLSRSKGVWLQNAAVGLKLLLLFGFVAVGAMHLATRQPEMPLVADPVASGLGSHDHIALDLGAFAVSLVWISFAYSGWNAASYVAGEVRDPQRNATRALWVGCVVVAILYVALNAVFLYAAPANEIAGQADIGAIAARALGGDTLWRVTSGIVALALLTSISAMMMAGPRVYARMAEDGLFPRQLMSRGNTPVTAVALQSTLAIAVVWWTGLAQLLSYVGFTLSLSTAATVLGLLRLRHREGAVAVPIIGYPVVPIVYVTVTLGAASYMVARQPGEAAFGLLTVVAGVPLYFAAKRRQAKRRMAP